jgi:hypothetical protein
MAVIDAVEGLSKIYQREGVLTLYASVDPTISYRRGNEVAAAKSALRTLERSLAVELRPQFERERDTALRFLERERTGRARLLRFSPQNTRASGRQSRSMFTCRRRRLSLIGRGYFRC